MSQVLEIDKTLQSMTVEFFDNPKPSMHRYHKSLAVLAAVFITAASLLLYGLSLLPKSEHTNGLRIPKNVADLIEMREMLSKYTTDYYAAVVFGFMSLYIFLQAFAIPGSAGLSVLSGGIFGFPLGLLIVEISATIGSSCCYLLSYHIGRPVIQRLFHQRLMNISSKVQEQQQRNNLFMWMLFIRISPLFPNWFINICSPIIDIPYWIFASATALGIMPASIIQVKAGLILSDLRSLSDILGPKTLVFLLLVGVCSLLPMYVRDHWNLHSKHTRQS